MSTIKTSIKEDLVECLGQQISEIDLLQSMYPNPGDIILSDKNIAEINNFINSVSKSEYIPNNLDFVINLHLNNLKLELFINLPVSYPNEEPDIYIRCNQLNRQQETSLNTDLMEFIKTKHIGEVCLYTAITWLQDNIDLYAKDMSTSESISEKNELQIKQKFSRFWIYSHHIYNKKKREDILKLAKELCLTGFCLPGKPGVICVEGNNQACNEWWRNIKSMCWKKISIRKTEDFELSEETEQRKFNNFEELYFKRTTNNKHSNMSEFSKYMNNLGFGQIFNDFFNLENE